MEIRSTTTEARSSNPVSIETAPTNQSPQSSPRANSIQIVFDSDYQHNLIRKVSPIQSVTFDRRISVSLRPQALVLSTPILQRQSDNEIDHQFPNANRYQLGDLLDTSNTSEWVLFLVSTLDEDLVQELFALNGDTKTWTEKQWQSYLETLDEKNYDDYMGILYEYYKSSGKVIVAGPEGNHDGAAWGNGVERTRPLLQIEAQIIQYTAQKSRLENKIIGYEQQLSNKRVNVNKRKRLEQKISELNLQLTDINSKLTETLDAHEGEDRQYFYIKQKEYLETRIQRLERRSHGGYLNASQREATQRKIQVLARRIEYIDKKLQISIDERERAKRHAKDKPLHERINIIRYFSNIFMGIDKNQSLYDPKGYWAQNSGGTERNFDKSDFLFEYLKLRYPDLYIVSPTEESPESESTSDARYHFSRHAFLPLSTRIINSDNNTFKVETAVFDSVTSAAVTDENGAYKTEQAQIKNIEAKDKVAVEQNFNILWRETRPGEFVCIIDHPQGNDQNPNQRYLMIQAFHQGTVNGREVYNIFLDGMDGTEENVDIAFFATMSGLQRKICDVFMNEMRRRHDNKTLFLHSTHYPLRDHSQAYWKKAQWSEYFTQPDVAPFVFSGHGHERAVEDETRPTLFGQEVFFGKRPIKSKESFWGIMTPSTTDAPNEFMSVNLSYDEETGKYILEQSYHPILGESSYDSIPEDVRYEVTKLRQTYHHNHYHEYSEIKTGFVSGIQNILFGQDRILAYDSIPVSVGQFREALTYAKTYLKFLREDLGESAELVRLVEKTVSDLNRHFYFWMKGNPNSNDQYDRLGYLLAKEQSKEIKRQSDRVALLVNYNDVFDTPAYERLRLLIAQTPEDTKAYDFWVMLGLEAAREESEEPAKKHKHKHKKHAQSEDFRFEFS